MATTTATVSLTSHGTPIIAKTLGSSAQNFAIAEELANLYVAHILPSEGRVSGTIQISVQQSENGNFTHTVSFERQEVTPLPNRQTIAPLLHRQAVASFFEQGPAMAMLDFDNPGYTDENSDTEGNDDLRRYGNTEQDGTGEGEQDGGRRRTSRPRQPSVTDSVLPGEEPSYQDDKEQSFHHENRVSDLPCLRCAKRIIHDSTSKSATNMEKGRSDRDGTVMSVEYNCKHQHGRKCNYESCTKGDKRCDEIPGALRSRCRELLKLAKKVHDEDTPYDANKEQALKAQRRFNTKARGIANNKTNTRRLTPRSLSNAHREAGKKGKSITSNGRKSQDSDVEMSDDGGYRDDGGVITRASRHVSRLSYHGMDE